jgi:hypothetical protein
VRGVQRVGVSVVDLPVGLANLGEVAFGQPGSRLVHAIGWVVVSRSHKYVVLLMRSGRHGGQATTMTITRNSIEPASCRGHGLPSELWYPASPANRIGFIIQAAQGY